MTKAQLYTAKRRIESGKLVIDISTYCAFDLMKDGDLKPIMKR